MKVDPKEAFIGDSVEAYTWQGEIWGVPVESNGVGSMVNVPRADVEAAGLLDQYPPFNGEIFFESYEQMWELAKALQVEEGGKVVKWGLSSQGWEDASYLGILRSLLAPQGTDWWDVDNKKFNFDTEEGVEAMKLFVETPVQMGIETQLDQSSVDAALAGKVALARGNGTPSMPEAWKLGYTYYMAGAPKVRPPELPIFCGEGGWGFVALKQAKHPELAIEFLRMMCTFEAQQEYCKIYGGQPNTAWKGLIGVYDHFVDPNPEGPLVWVAKVFQEHLGPQTKYYGERFGSVAEINNAIVEACAEVRQRRMTSAEAVKLIQERSEAQYKEYVKQVKDLGLEP
jgi:ABC-type glycerol-3-phosphate transport system substrate-binding protein